MKPFNVEKEFQMYCERVGLNLDTCHPTQVIETRRAFHAGIGQLLLYLRDDLSKVSEDEGVTQLQSALEQVGAFWKRQATGSTGGN